MQEKLIFIKEYMMFKTQYFDIDKKLYLLEIFKTMPIPELAQNATLNEIKLYIENFIEIYKQK